MLAVLCLSLAVCVLGRPQPSSASPQYSTVQALGNSALQGWNRISGIPDLGSLEVPWRRSLKSRAGGTRGGAGGLGGVCTTEIIIVVASIAAFVLLLAALACWCSSKKRKNPNWRPTDCLRRNKVPREKMFASVKSDVDPDADAEHKVSMAIDGPRLDHAKSRKQVSPI